MRWLFLETCFAIYSTAGVSFPIVKSFPIAGHGETLIRDSSSPTVTPRPLMECLALNGGPSTSFAIGCENGSASESICLHYSPLGLRRRLFSLSLGMMALHLQNATLGRNGYYATFATPTTAMLDERHVAIAKHLSFLLRHGMIKMSSGMYSR